MFVAQIVRKTELGVCALLWIVGALGVAARFVVVDPCTMQPTERPKER